MLPMLLEFFVLLSAWKVAVFGDFLVLIFPHLDWIRKDSPYLSVFNPNARNYGPKKHRIRTVFTQWLALPILLSLPISMAVPILLAAQKMQFAVSRSFLQIWSHLPKKFLMEKFFLCSGFCYPHMSWAHFSLQLYYK